MLFFSFTNMFSATTISKCACLRLFIVENQGIHIHIIAACIYVIKQRLITERKLYSIHGRDFTNMFSFETCLKALCLVYICKGCCLKYCCEQYPISCSNLTALTFQWNGSIYVIGWLISIDGLLYMETEQSLYLLWY